jgi:hypothetical protein
MKVPARIAKILSASIVGAVLAATPLFAQSENVNVTYNHDFAFNKIKSYTWARVQTTDPMLEPRLTAAVDHMLQGLGWHLVSKNADLVVSAVESDDSRGYATFYRQLTGYTWQRSWGNGGFADESASLRTVPAGTVVLDMYNPADKKLIWRGVASEPVAAKEKTKQDDTDKVVKIMFESFPPRSGGPMAPNQFEVPASNSGVTPTGTNP